MDGLVICFLVVVVCLVVAGIQYDKVYNRKRDDEVNK